MFKAIGKVPHEIESDHHDFENDIGELENIIATKNWSELYAAFALFLGKYLIHLDAEEKKQSQVLWQYYQDSDLLAVFNRFKKDRSSENAKFDLQLMLPALSAGELARIFSGMKAGAPEEAYKGACNVAISVLGEDRWLQIQKLIAAAA